MKRKCALLFDWDGTLINSFKIKIANLAELFQIKLGFDPVRVADSYSRHSGLPRRQLFNAICIDNSHVPLKEREYKVLSKRFSEMNLKKLANPHQDGLIPQDTIDALTNLKAVGYPLYISSSATTGEIHEIASALGLDTFFEEILGSSAGFSKGSEHIEYVKRNHPYELNQIVFIGDDPNDIHLGKSAGAFTIAKIGTHPEELLLQAKPDRIIHSLQELPAILEEIAPNG